MAQTTIDLSALPAPSVIETLDYEAILSAMTADLAARAPELAPVLALDSEPVVKLLQVCAYRELILRARLNDAARGVFLATAIGPDLENLAALFGIDRRVITPANPFATPPILAVLESDSALRARVVEGPAGLSVAGPRSAYVYHAKAAHPDVLDVAVTAPTPTPGLVDVVVLSRVGSGGPSALLLGAVTTALTAEDIRPLTDQVQVRAATLVPLTVTATLTLFEGPSAEPILEAANAALDAYLLASKRLGGDITISGLHASLHQPGVARVTLTAPVTNLVIAPDQCHNVVSRTVVVGGRDD